MDKINRLVWADGFSFKAYGLRVGVRANHADAITKVRSLLPPGSQAVRERDVDVLFSMIAGGADPRPQVRRFNLLYRDATRVVRTLALDEFYDGFEHDLQMCVAEFARRVIFIHAGVVSWQGKAILLPGPSRSGKSTLVAELLRRGAGYYSDEYAVLDGQGRVHPYARPLALRQTEGRPVRKFLPEQFGSASGRRPLEVGVIAVSTFRPGARWRPRRRSPADGALDLVASAVAARRRPKRVLATLGRVVRDVPIWKGVRGEAGAMADFLLQQCEAATAPVA